MVDNMFTKTDTKNKTMSVKNNYVANVNITLCNSNIFTLNYTKNLLN